MATVDSSTGAASKSRFCLWIDGVGGALVCLAERIVLGRPGDGGPDVAIQADLSRRHAEIRRQGETYVLVPRGESPVRLDGRRIDRPTPLGDDCRITLGEGVELRFCVPHPLSATARLEPAGMHRFADGCDAVLLMATTCVLGPAAGSHVVCPWRQEVILFRNQTDLYCRSNGPIEIDNVRHTAAAPIGWNARVCGEDFAFALEKIENRLL